MKRFLQNTIKVVTETAQLTLININQLRSYFG